jgi:diketogulonate reductase-like aldo/keto reductase
MGSNIIPELTVGSSGKTIPLVGFGTAESSFGASPATMKESILHAMKVGYRHFDSAAIYQSEQIIGEAIDDALCLGFIKSRDELFITSKLWINNAHPHLVLPALRQTLK